MKYRRNHRVPPQSNLPHVQQENITNGFVQLQLVMTLKNEQKHFQIMKYVTTCKHYAPSCNEKI